jgi:hypothetical protein
MSTVYRTVPSIDLLTRESRPIPLATAVVKIPVRVDLPTPPPIDRIDPKGVTTVTPASKISGNPIGQLRETRNPFLTPNPKWGMATVNPAGHPEKRGIYERAGAVIPILRESFDVSARRGQARRGLFIKALNVQKPTVRLGLNGSGLDFYRAPREKPALPYGTRDFIAAVRGITTRGQRYQDFSTPAGTGSRLASEGQSADAAMRVPTATRPVARDLDTIRIAPGALVTASTHPAPFTTGAGPWILGGLLVFVFMAGR